MLDDNNGEVMRFIVDRPDAEFGDPEVEEDFQAAGDTPWTQVAEHFDCLIYAGRDLEKSTPIDAPPAYKGAVVTAASQVSSSDLIVGYVDEYGSGAAIEIISTVDPSRPEGVCVDIDPCEEGYLYLGVPDEEYYVANPEEEFGDSRAEVTFHVSNPVLVLRRD